MVGTRVGVYEDGWQKGGERWLAKGWAFMRLVGKRVGEGGWHTGGGL